MLFSRRAQDKPQRQVYMLIHQIGMQAGGMTLSMMTRANLFAKNGWSAALVTTDEKRDYREIEAEYRRIGALAEGVRILNVFDHHRDRAGHDDGRHPEYADLTRVDEAGMFSAISAGSNARGRRYFDTVSGRYRLYKQCRTDGTLEYVRLLQRRPHPDQASGIRLPGDCSSRAVL